MEIYLKMKLQTMKKTFKIQHTNQEKRFAVWFHLVFLHVFH